MGIRNARIKLQEEIEKARKGRVKVIAGVRGVIKAQQTENTLARIKDAKRWKLMEKQEEARRKRVKKA
ncbi:hypothetical protein H0N95_01710 [Candidatus Micrarchaeota archaeon]|nr:hypothetical protein [Candidatus Micrarchaeota archaeon]